MTSQWARWRLKSQALRLFTQPFIHAQIVDNIKAPRHWPLCGEFTGDRWIPRTEDQWRGKGFHLMTSSWHDDMVWPVDSPHEGPGSNAENVFMSQHHHVWLTLVIAMGVQQVYCPLYSFVWFVACIHCLWNYVYRRTRVINGTNNNLNPPPPLNMS